jgi:hypothetical protein
MAGIFFEAAAQHRLQDGTDLELLLMVQLPKSRDRTLPRWHSSHSVLQNTSLEALRQQVFQEKFTITIRPSQTIEYADAGLSHASQDVFYVPGSANTVVLDSFIVINGFLYIFQFTIASEHDVETGLIDLLGKRQGVPPMDNWRFVFVTPPDSTLTVRLLKLHELRPYTSVIRFAD